MKWNTKTHEERNWRKRESDFKIISFSDKTYSIANKQTNANVDLSKVFT